MLGPADGCSDCLPRGRLVIMSPSTTPPMKTMAMTARKMSANIAEPPMSVVKLLITRTVTRISPTLP